MARALTAGPAPRRRAFFGLLDADGWSWAGLKAFFWFIVIIFLLGYVPDRAYYFTVSRTIDLGILAWSPINLCPPNNGNFPCPAPAGSVLPWQASPPELALPEPRADGAVVQAGTNLLHIGGSDGEAATDTVFVAEVVGIGSFDQWQEGPALPEPRADAGVAFLNGIIYVTGGYGPDGQPTDTTFVLQPDLQTGDLGTWQTAEEVEQPIDLPEARAAAPVIPLPDGLLIAGGVGPGGEPVATVWKSKLDAQGLLGEWVEQPALVAPAADAVGLLNGDAVWVIGGRDGQGPTQRVQVARSGLEPISGDENPGGADSGVVEEPGEGGTVGEGVNPDDPPGAGSPTPGEPVQGEGLTAEIGDWTEGTALPEPRADAMGYASNGTVYVIGGSDGTETQNELYWAVPTGDAGERIDEWKHLVESDLPEPGLARAAIGLSGANLMLVGGVSGDQPTVGTARSSTAPEEPFFQLGLVGVVVPALQIQGEIGQQLGYLNAAGVGGAMFALLIAIGYFYAHREQARRLWTRFRRR